MACISENVCSAALRPQQKLVLQFRTFINIYRANNTGLLAWFAHCKKVIFLEKKVNLQRYTNDLLYTCLLKLLIFYSSECVGEEQFLYTYLLANSFLFKIFGSCFTKTKQD
jgi:hypothetical protein